MSSHDRHPPGTRRTGPDERAEPEIPADDGDPGEWESPGLPDQAGQGALRDDHDEYEPL